MARELRVAAVTPTTLSDAPVMAIHDWVTNAALIADCARLGYLRPDWRTLDPTYGYGTFWKLWRPDVLVAHDLDRDLSPAAPMNFACMTYPDRSFDAVVLDGPYKLNGTPSEADVRFGVHEVATRDERMSLIRSGITECARVLGDGYFLLKCQDQVNGGKVRWQTYDFTKHAESCGLGLVDRFEFLSYRAQPHGVRQVHARRNASTLLVFKRGWRS